MKKKETLEGVSVLLELTKGLAIMKPQHTPVPTAS